MDTVASEFGVSRGLPGLCENLMRFLSHLAETLRPQVIPAPELPR